LFTLSSDNSLFRLTCYCFLLLLIGDIGDEGNIMAGFNPHIKSPYQHDLPQMTGFLAWRGVFRQARHVLSIWWDFSKSYVPQVQTTGFIISCNNIIYYVITPYYDVITYDDICVSFVTFTNGNTLLQILFIKNIYLKKLFLFVFKYIYFWKYFYLS